MKPARTGEEGAEGRTVLARCLQEVWLCPGVHRAPRSQSPVSGREEGEGCRGAHLSKEWEGVSR